jgi:hypothetical protein
MRCKLGISLLALAYAQGALAAAVPSLWIAPISLNQEQSMPTFLTTESSISPSNPNHALIHKQLNLVTTQITANLQANANIQLVSESDLPPAKFTLSGKVNAMDAGESVSPINGTTKFSSIYNFDLAVEYTLIRNTDKKVIATFTAAGHSGIAHLITNPKDKFMPNESEMLNQVGNELAAEVVTTVNNLVQTGKFNLDEESTVVKK